MAVICFGGRDSSLTAGCGRAEGEWFFSSAENSREGREVHSHQWLEKGRK